MSRLAIAALLALTAGCGGSPVPSAVDLDLSYQAALVRTQNQAVALPGIESGTAALPAPLVAYFTRMTAESAARDVGAVYAPAAYLNDTLAAVDGSRAIGGYFARTAGRVRNLRVDFLDVARTGVEHYVRWRMTIESERLNGGRAMVSYGVTHFRFDADGRVLVHKDFWDAAGGLYEYLPGIGNILRRVRAAVEADS